MSPIDFDTLQADYPEYATAWAALREWFASNWRKQYVELSVLLRAIKRLSPSISDLDVILAIQTMVEHRMLALAYRVKAPSGELLEGDFERPDKVPAELPDRDHSGYVKSEEADIVSGYRWEPADAA